MLDVVNDAMKNYDDKYNFTVKSIKFNTFNKISITINDSISKDDLIKLIHYIIDFVNDYFERNIFTRDLTQNKYGVISFLYHQ